MAVAARKECKGLIGTNSRKGGIRNNWEEKKESGEECAQERFLAGWLNESGVTAQ